MSFTNTSLLAISLVACACSTVPAIQIPEPLPEVLEWAATSSAEGAAYLGLKTRENDSGSLDALFFEPGLRVVRVIENSPAAVAGFAVGDVLLEFRGSEVSDPSALETLLERSIPGERVVAKVQRGDTVFEVPVVVSAVGAEVAGNAKAIYLRDPARSSAGWLTSKGGAILVTSSEDGPFPDAGVPVGSVVMEIDGVAVLSARSLIRQLQALPSGSEVEVRYQTPEGSMKSAEVELLDEGSVLTGLQFPILFNYTHDVAKDSTEFALIDLWFISLFRFTRLGEEREYRVLRWIQFSSGEGELSE